MDKHNIPYPELPPLTAGIHTIVFDGNVSTNAPFNAELITSPEIKRVVFVHQHPLSLEVGTNLVAALVARTTPLDELTVGYDYYVIGGIGRNPDQIRIKMLKLRNIANNTHGRTLYGHDIPGIDIVDLGDLSTFSGDCWAIWRDITDQFRGTVRAEIDERADLHLEHKHDYTPGASVRRLELVIEGQPVYAYKLIRKANPDIAAARI